MQRRMYSTQQFVLKCEPMSMRENGFPATKMSDCARVTTVLNTYSLHMLLIGSAGAPQAFVGSVVLRNTAENSSPT